MFVEVKVLCDGEMPNGVGNLLLGPEEIQQLFYNENTYRLNIEKKSIGVIIPKKVLTTITNDSISHAVKEPLIKTQEKQGYSQKRGETSETDPYFG